MVDPLEIASFKFFFNSILDSDFDSYEIYEWLLYRREHELTRTNRMDFIAKLLEVTRTVESPKSFLIWAGYSAVAAVLRDNIWIPFGARRTKIFPNLYVLIIGDSGETRKSTPLKIMNYLVKAVGNTKLIEGRASIQGVLKEMSNNHMTPTGVMLKDASALLYTEELAAFMVGDPQALKILCDIYDYHEEHNITLKGDDVVKLRNVVTNLIAATNAAFLSDMFSKIDLFGGLVGRTLLIIEEKARHRDLGLRDDTTEEDWQLLVNHLKKIAKFKGPATIEPTALDFLDDWYKKLDVTVTSKTGFEPRIHTFVLKLSMIISACRMDRPFEGKISVLDVEEAISALATLTPNYFKIVNAISLTTNTVAAAAKEIMKLLIMNPNVEIEHSSLLRQLFGKVDSETLNKAVDTLNKADMIEVKSDMGKAKYGLTPKSIEMFLGKAIDGTRRVQ